MTDKKALITGGAKRIGKTIALSMAKNGYDVAVHYNSSKKEAKDLQLEIEQIGQECVIINADLSKTKDVRNIFKKANKELGFINCLINNAAILENDNVSTMTESSLERLMSINFQAPVVLSQEFAAQLPDGTNGNIINMLDYCVLNLPEKFFSYSMSKSALWSATQFMAKSLAPRIRVNAIGPGHSLKNEKESQEKFDDAISHTPLQNNANPDEICAAIKYILSTESMTGQILALDGGKHLIGANFY